MVKRPESRKKPAEGNPASGQPEELPPTPINTNQALKSNEAMSRLARVPITAFHDVYKTAIELSDINPLLDAPIPQEAMDRTIKSIQKIEHVMRALNGTYDLKPGAVNEYINSWQQLKTEATQMFEKVANSKLPEQLSDKQLAAYKPDFDGPDHELPAAVLEHAQQVQLNSRAAINIIKDHLQPALQHETQYREGVQVLAQMAQEKLRAATAVKG